MISRSIFDPDADAGSKTADVAALGSYPRIMRSRDFCVIIIEVKIHKASCEEGADKSRFSDNAEGAFMHMLIDIGGMVMKTDPRVRGGSSKIKLPDAR